MSNAVMDLLAANSGGSWAKFTNSGDKVEGTVVAAEPRQVTNFQTKAPEFNKDGSPKMSLVLTLADGTKVDAKTGLLRSLGTATRVAGVADIVGSGVSIELTGTVQVNGFNAKQYAVTVTAPDASGVEVDEDEDVPWGDE